MPRECVSPEASMPDLRFFCRRVKPSALLAEGFLMWSLAVTYFRERKLTIIGALLFHGPVREGKGWVQKAMAAKRNLCCLPRGQTQNEEEGVL